MGSCGAIFTARARLTTSVKGGGDFDGSDGNREKWRRCWRLDEEDEQETTFFWDRTRFGGAVTAGLNVEFPSALASSEDEEEVELALQRDLKAWGGNWRNLDRWWIGQEHHEPFVTVVPWLNDVLKDSDCDITVTMDENGRATLVAESQKNTMLLLQLNQGQWWNKNDLLNLWDAIPDEKPLNVGKWNSCLSPLEQLHALSSPAIPQKEKYFRRKLARGPNCNEGKKENNAPVPASHDTIRE
ncbi:hypothetical protein C8J56DRAFT_890610 [Mycena floridula]|nr:hypothetical protein C8J56DRAFT_890610 [Mycena floridula]